jgi:acetyltransferase-like isoleucine patch superfamily enzyme
MIARNSHLGFLIRRLLWLFRSIKVPACDESCRIHPMASFEGHPKNVSFGKGVIVDAFARFYCHSNGSISVGDYSYIGPNAFIHTGKKGGRVEIGSNCTVQAFSIIQGHGGCVIGNDVRIAPHTVITAANHKYEDTSKPIREQGLTKEGIHISDDVWVGAGTMILDGVNIGRGCVIGAGSVVTKSLSAGSVAVGVPARQVANRFE